MNVFQKILLTCVCFAGAFTATVQQAQAEDQRGFYRVRKLVSNQPCVARFTDPNLINPWGLALSVEGTLVVANNGTNLATVYEKSGRPTNFQIIVNETPTGIAHNFSPEDFIISNGTIAREARFLFATEDGTILAYNGEVNLHEALLVVDRSEFNSVYKGAAISKIQPLCHHQSLYATDFHNAKVDVFDHEFNFRFSFTDPEIPDGYGPFNIRNIDEHLYVTYAKQLPPDNHDDEAGPGHGFVDIFRPDGTLIKRLISHGKLNSPWGLALAPKGFGKFSGALLVGNFGDGRIHAYNPLDGQFLGTISDRQEDPVVIDGLWSLEFVFKKMGKFTKPVLYFTAGPMGESGGLLGTIVVEKRKRPRPPCHK